jgi:asparagine synthase (glutamine-hydrolysing)
VLIERAYERWGEACPDHLLGDWSFAVWHPQERRLFLARDHYGNTALYYYGHDGHRFAFASDGKALLRLPHVPQRLNELYLAQGLVAWTPDDGSDTIYLDIHRLPPAHAMRVTPDGIHIWRYWRLEDTPDLALPTDDAYVEAFLDIFHQAVHCRLRSYRPVGTTLSGGLDSGSVTALAARALAQQGRTLTAFTSVPMYDVTTTTGSQRFGDEWPFAAATADHAGNVEHIPIRAETVSPIAGVQRMLEVLGEPLHAASNYYWIVALLASAQQRGLGTLLTGQTGNVTISWSGLPSSEPLLSYLHRGAYSQALRQKLLRPLMPAWFLQRYNQWRQCGTWRLLAPPWRAYAAIHPAFARRLKLRERMVAAGHDPTFSAPWRDARQARCASLQPAASFYGAWWAQSGAAYGLEIRDPTQDKRLMAFTLAVPETQWRGVMDRWLLRRAMAGLLPDAVRLNQRRGLQASDLIQRLRDYPQEMTTAVATLQTCGIVDCYLDLAYIRQVYETLLEHQDVATTIQASTILMRGLSAGLFLVYSADGACRSARASAW